MIIRTMPTPFNSTFREENVDIRRTIHRAVARRAEEDSLNFQNGYAFVFSAMVRWGDFLTDVREFLYNRKISRPHLKKPHLNGPVCDERLRFTVISAPRGIRMFDPDTKEGEEFVSYTPIMMDKHHTKQAILMGQMTGITEDTFVRVDFYVTEPHEDAKKIMQGMHNLYKTFDSRAAVQTPAQELWTSGLVHGSMFEMCTFAAGAMKTTILAGLKGSITRKPGVIDSEDFEILNVIEPLARFLDENIAPDMKQLTNRSPASKVLHGKGRTFMTVGFYIGLLTALDDQKGDLTKMIRIVEKLNKFYHTKMHDENDQLVEKIQMGKTSAAGVKFEQAGAYNYFSVND